MPPAQGSRGVQDDRYDAKHTITHYRVADTWFSKECACWQLCAATAGVVGCTPVLLVDVVHGVLLEDSYLCLLVRLTRGQGLLHSRHSGAPTPAQAAAALRVL